MSDRISLVRWKNAKTNPPDYNGLFATEVGHVYYMAGAWRNSAYGPATVTPSVWCDPSPPGDDALTVTDLRNIAAAVSIAAHLTRSSLDATTFTALAGRLHRAIEEAER